MNNLRRRPLLSASNGETGRGTIGGYEFVDLGLSSGLLFATCNVGANSETDYGGYYKYGSGSTEYDPDDPYTGYNGNENPLASSADTATQVMGSGWRMPTQAEFQDLINNTNYEWVTNFNGSGVNGGKFTSKTNPNAYVFFPAAGEYRNGSNGGTMGNQCRVWSSTPDNSIQARYLYLSSGSTDANIYLNGRNNGFSVRGVHAAPSSLEVA